MNILNIHIKLFLFGFIFYLLVPLLIGYTGYFEALPGMENWHKDFSGLTQSKIITYILIIFSYLVSFIFGSYSIYLFKTKKDKINFGAKRQLHGTNLLLIGLIFLIFVIFITKNNYNILFTGYTTYKSSVLASLATVNIVSLFFIYYSIFYKLKRYNMYIFLVILIVTSILLLGLGSRMYVLIPIISMFVYRVNYSDNKWIIKHLFIYLLIALVGLLYIGVWRSNSDVSIEFMAYIFFAEPVFTWWSTISFLNNNVINTIDIPLNYLSSFLNMLPSFIFEDKSLYIIRLNEKFIYEKPLGAQNIFVSIQGNFGWLLGSVYMFFMGLYFSVVFYLSKKYILFRIYYILIISILPFQYYRDAFSIINKQLYWNMFIVPILIISMLFIINIILFKRSRNANNI
jgi:hypothetical protein